MKFYFTFRGTDTPGKNDYMAVNAPCESTAIDRLHAKQLRHWESVYTSDRLLRRAGLKLWREI